MERELDGLHTEFSLAYTTLFCVIHQLAPEHREQVGVSGAWSPREMIAHLIGWDRALSAFIADPKGFDPAPLYNRQTFNATSVSTRCHQSWDDTIDEWQDSYRTLQQALIAVTNDMPIYARVCWWLRGRQRDYAFHTRQLEAWMAQQGSVLP